MSQSKYFYMYKVVNKVTGSQYIGVHETWNLDDGYMGSGTIISRAIRKYGLPSFEKTILEFFDSRESMYEREREVVTEEYVNRKDVMNIALGGTGGSMVTNQKPFKGPHSEATRKKISDINKGKRHTDETKQKLSANNFARTRPQEQRQHAINAGKKRWVFSDHESHKEETKRKISESVKKYHEINPRSEQTMEKIINSQRLRRLREKEANIQKIWIHSPVERISKMIDSKCEIPLGWVKGRKIKFD